MFAGHGTRIPAAAGKVVGMFSGWLPSPFAPGEDETPQQAKAAREKVDPKDMEGKKSCTTLHLLSSIQCTRVYSEICTLTLVTCSTI